jgi:membrane protein required for colicin V production
MLVKEETLNDSIFYNPTKEISAFVYPQIEEWYESFSENSKEESQKEELNTKI